MTPGSDGNGNGRGQLGFRGKILFLMRGYQASE